MSDRIMAPNFTQIPNVFLENMFPQMSEAELRVTLAIMRETFGWRRCEHEMSLSYFVEATGMSKQGVLNGINAGIERGIIYRTQKGQSYAYGLVVNEVDQNASSSQRSRPKVVNEVDRTSQRSRPKVVNEVDTTNKGKKDLKKRNKGGPQNEQADHEQAVVDLLTEHYKSQPFGHVTSHAQVERKLDEHTGLIEEYGLEEYLRAAQDALAYHDIRHASKIEAQIVRNRKQQPCKQQRKRQWRQ